MDISCTSANTLQDFPGSNLSGQFKHDQTPSLARQIDQVRDLMQSCLDSATRGPAQLASEYQINSGGTLLRARLALISGAAFNCTADYSIAAATACELVHNASLVHDDLCDGDISRRDRTTVWKQFGKRVALCSGDLLLCAAFDATCRVKDASQARELTKLVARLSGEVIVGQSLEVALVNEGETPGFRQYLEATRAKTVPLIQLPLTTGAIVGHDDPETLAAIRRLAESIGLAYQILDDLDDLKGPQHPLHNYHAWHHHRIPTRDSRRLRIGRAVRHAMAALQRAQHNLDVLAAIITPRALDNQLTTLIEQLRDKALMHLQQSDQLRDTIPYATLKSTDR